MFGISFLLLVKCLSNLEISSQIENLIFPASVIAGEPFSISYDARSIVGATKYFYGYIIDTVTQLVIEGTYWASIIAPGLTYTFQISDVVLENPLTGQIVIGHLTPEICDWIDSKGGPAGLTIMHVFEIIDAYIFETPPSGWDFIPTIMEVFGVVDYYLGFDGGTSTGCEFEI